MELSDWVNQARNICWFSGYSWGVSNGYLMLKQAASDSKIIRIKVSPGFRPPSDNQVVEVKCHCFAEGGRVQLHAIRIKRASLVAMPRRAAMLDALRKHGSNYDPFKSPQAIREEIKASLKLDDATVDAIIKQAGAVQGRDSGFVNKLILSGFVGFKGFVQPEEGEERGHVRLMLQQHSNPDRAIPIRILGADARYGQALQSNMPINVVAEARCSTSEAGDPVITIVSDKNNVGRSGEHDFEHRKFPAWWVDMLATIYAKLKQGAPDHGDASIRDNAQGVRVLDSSNGDGLMGDLGIKASDLAD
ncbi:hypothetical protein AB7849_15265 [Rhodanobacter sp. 115]|uniref:hypothetical protein n=1 Tax=Rhodanobacter sp. FW021-MT20 TaxID=1162282 RepID=UPI0034E48FA9